MKFNAQAAAAQIESNVSRVNAKSITWAEFGELQRAAWDAVSQGEMNIIGSECNKRHAAVIKLLNV